MMPDEASFAAELRSQAARAQALADFSHAANVAVDDFDASLRVVAQRTAEALGDTCTINLLSDDGRFVEPAARYTPDPRHVPVVEAFDRRGPLPLEVFRPLGVFEGGGTLFAPSLEGPLAEYVDAQLRSGGMPADDRVRGLICVPLHSRGAVIGALLLARSDPGLPDYTEADRSFAEELAVRAAIAIDNARLFRRVQAMSGALALSEERLQACFAAAPIGIVMHDLEGRVIEANDAFARMLDRDAIELTGTRVELVTGESAARLGRQRDEAEERVVARFDQRLVRRGGGELDLRISATLVRGVAGDPLFSLAVVEDVTEQRRLEAQLRQGLKMDALGRLAGGVAHDFNNLLTAILGFGEHLAAGLEDRPDLAADAGEILSAATRGAALTRQLLAFSRNQVSTRRVVDPGAVASDLALMLDRLLGNDVELVIDAPERLAVVADPHQLEQVLVNLAVNARDAMPAGGQLTVFAQRAEIGREHEIPDLPAGHYAVLTVTDDGTGMDAETATRAFEPFFTTKPAGAGTGLGLSTVFGIVRNHGGGVTVDSEPGRGTTVRVLLPLHDGAAEPAHQPSVEPPRPRGTTRTILIAEDDASVRELVRRTLEDAGHRVLAAADGAAALTLASERIDLLLTDMTMPDMTGRELAEHLRGELPSLPVLFSSGWVGANMPSPVTDERTWFLEKPFRLAELLERVDVALADI